MSMENQKEIGDQLRKINIENARKEIKKALGEGYKKIDSNEIVEVYRKEDNYFSFNKNTGKIIKLSPEQLGGTFGTENMGSSKIDEQSFNIKKEKSTTNKNKYKDEQGGTFNLFNSTRE